VINVSVIDINKMLVTKFIRKAVLASAPAGISSGFGFGFAAIIQCQATTQIAKPCLRCLSTKYAYVGKLEEPREHGKPYDTGQLFLHKVFGYRGIVLFPWLAHVYDRDSSKSEERPFDDQTSTVGKEVKGRNHMYYQVLIDARDCPHIRAQTEAVTFLGNQDNSRAV